MSMYLSFHTKYVNQAMEIYLLTFIVDTALVVRILVISWATPMCVRWDISMLVKDIVNILAALNVMSFMEKVNSFASMVENIVEIL